MWEDHSTIEEMYIMQRLFISLILCLGSLPLTAQVQTGASIKPLQLLFAAVTDGVTETPALFMRTGADPHHYALRPSDRRAMAQSDVILWVGPALETPLEKVMGDLSGEVITAQDLPGMALLSAGGGIDSHLWLSAENAIRMAEALVQSLSRLDAGNAERYAANSEQLATALRALVENTRQRLQEQEEASAFAVYHNAFGYFEQQLGVSHQVAFTDNEDVAPGVRRLLQVRKQVAQHEIRCVLVEAGVDIGQLQNVIDNDEVSYIEMDPLAWEFPVSGTAFLSFMEEISNSFVDCLSL